MFIIPDNLFSKGILIDILVPDCDYIKFPVYKESKKTKISINSENVLTSICAKGGDVNKIIYKEINFSAPIFKSFYKSFKQNSNYDSLIQLNKSDFTKILDNRINLKNLLTERLKAQFEIDKLLLVPFDFSGNYNTLINFKQQENEILSSFDYNLFVNFIHPIQLAQLNFIVGSICSDSTKFSDFTNRLLQLNIIQNSNQKYSVLSAYHNSLQKLSKKPDEKAIVFIWEKYFMNEAINFLNINEVAKINRTIVLIKNSFIGDTMRNLKFRDFNFNEFELHKLKSKYSIIVFWDSDVRHNKNTIGKAVHKFRTLNLKEKGFELVNVLTMYNKDKWLHNLTDWNIFDCINVTDRFGENQWYYYFDSDLAKEIPMVYLLDENKTIIAKWDEVERYLDENFSK
ncbi:MAG: hypothetical protein IPJ22_05700 [Bacteroidetes bacterium]|nr:hypothetical protein [Bacteroidota bacterium]